MKTWNSEGHLTELALERWAVGEAEGLDRQRVTNHIRTCEACAARQAEWEEFVHALSALPSLEPSRSFDELVLARVRKPSVREQHGIIPHLGRRLRRAAVAAAALWAAVLAGGGVWMATSLTDSPGALAGQGLAYIHDLLWAGVVRVAALLQVSGIVEAWNEVASAVPGPSVLSAVALMTAFGGLALWGLYRVTGYRESRIKAHA